VVREHSLSNIDVGVAIFQERAEKEIHNLDSTQSRDALTAMVNCLSSSVPTSVVEKAYKTCSELEQLRQGDLRIYVKLVTDVPNYNVLWVFAVKKHRYRNLGKFDARACKKVMALESVSTPDEIEQYLADRQALTVQDLKDLRNQL